MPTLSPELGAARRALDYRAAMALRSPVLTSVAASAAGSKTPVTREEGERGKATVYLVEYDLKFLTGPGLYANRVRVRIDLGLSPDYPFTAPDVTVVSSPRPWSPHVHASSGAVCIGEIWSNAKGRMLIAHLVCHVAKVFNCDEPDRGAWYVGWNQPAVEYWRKVMKRQPVTPGLVYPVPPPEITHAVDASFGPPRPLGLGLPPTRPAGTGLRRSSGGLRTTKSLGGKS